MVVVVLSVDSPLAKRYKMHVPTFEMMMMPMMSIYIHIISIANGVAWFFFFAFLFSRFGLIIACFSSSGCHQFA